MYQVLYRKWRPKVFSDVAGQPHVTDTLASEILHSRLSHAYLFTGSRGTGKTTCAKILAKAVNCLSPVNGSPCNDCEICRGIDSGAILDVVEIDAASNNGVDNIRDIRDEVNFTPASCKYRVYIIDEVHMLSDGAFNALLKTLEEPPEHVIFILATTEVHKLPATILSRCQRFDFRRIPSEDMAQRMTYIADSEGITLEQDAAMLISRLADGALRDALSILDQCATRDKCVTASLVSDVAGLTGRVYLFELTDAVCSHDTAAALGILDRLHNSSCDMERLCSELINHFRNLMIVKTVHAPAELILCTAQELEQYAAQSARLTLETVLYGIDILQAALLNIKKGVNRRIETEMALIRLCSPSLSTDTKAMVRRISILENTVKNGFTAAAQPTAPVSNEPVTDDETGDTAEQPDAQPSADTDGQKNASAADAGAAQNEQQPVTPPAHAPSASTVEFDRWPDVLTELGEINKPLWGVLLNSTAYVRESENKILIKSDNAAFSSFIRAGNNAADLRTAILNVTGCSYRLSLFKQSETAVRKKDSLDDLISRARAADIKLTVTE